VTWSAQVGPVLNEDSPDALRESIKRAYVGMLEKCTHQGIIQVYAPQCPAAGPGRGFISKPLEQGM
jgi:hypothetical protein